MQRIYFFFLLIPSLFILGCAPEGEDLQAENANNVAVPSTTTQASLLSDSGWVILFDGQDLSSFNEIGEGNWTIVDGYVESSDASGSHLVSKGQYTDFRLKVDFWNGVGSNSGVFIRCDSEESASPDTCYEINIYDLNENPDNRTGAIMRHSPPLITTETEGNWNTYDIVAQGSNITVMLNGNITAEIEDNTHPDGPFTLQSNGGTIRFGTVQIKPL